MTNSLSRGRSIIIYGPTGSGKTTLVGEYSKVLKRKGKKLLYHASDMGGYDSIIPHIDAGMIQVNEYVHNTDDPWGWINSAVKCRDMLTDDIGAVAFDSGTSMGEALMNYITHSDWKVGTQATQKFSPQGPGKVGLQIGLNNEAHFGLVQSFMLDQIWNSSWLVRSGLDVIWTFGEYKGEGVTDTMIGPLLVGKALTPKMSKWLKYTLRVLSVPVSDQVDRHRLQLTPQPELNGMAISMANARWPQDARTPCPAFIEPASIEEFFRLHEQASQEAHAALSA